MDAPRTLYDAIIALETVKAIQPPTEAEIAAKAAEMAARIDVDRIAANIKRGLARSELMRQAVENAPKRKKGEEVIS